MFKICRLGAASVIAMTSMAGVAVPAYASSTIRTTDAFVAMTTAPDSSPASPTLDRPAVKILRTGYSPSAITVAPRRFRTCTPARSDMKILNRTERKKWITYQGGVYGSIPARSVAYICQFGPAGFKFVYGLVRSSSTLTVTMS
jgi:hypothetical protein